MRLNLIQWGAISVIAAVFGTLASIVTVRLTLTVPLERLALTTPVFVLDRAAVIKALPPSASETDIHRTVATLREKAERLGEAGYVVIDGTAVLAAPKDLYVQLPR
ncbi:hypothetical protein [Methylocaldum szegediense]|jgi:hypothetical protein|uniref:hypothetical protein n=1 Tax=Methylocaldum szegediense TaxID=73780 RepID=UPI00041EDD46|nr:hypothetical protein [Methylocaldum szegediense]